MDSCPCNCWCDDSFDQLERGDAAFIMQNCDILIRYELNFFESGISPFHMEAATLLMAIQAATLLHFKNCTFFTDSELLVKTIQSKSGIHTLQVVDWRSYTKLVRISNLLKANYGYRCEFKPREENHKAHLLTNLARSGQFSYLGFTYPLFSNF